MDGVKVVNDECGHAGDQALRDAATAKMLVTALASTIVALALTLTLGGCGVAGTSGTLQDTSWRLTGWSLSSLDPGGFTITAKFADGEISGTSAVNSYGGSYTTGPGGAFAVSDVVSTLMAGEEPAMRAESAYMTLLGQAKSYGVKDGTLTLYDAAGNESLIFKTAVD